MYNMASFLLSLSLTDFLAFVKLLFSKTVEGQVLRIEVFVLCTIGTLVLLLILGSLRRRVGGRWSWIKYPTKFIYTMIPIAITYIMGLMNDVSNANALFPIWGCALIYAYGGVATMTACELSDNEDTLQYFWRTQHYILWTVGVCFIVPSSIYTSPKLLILLSVFLLRGAINTRETLISFYSASKSKGLPGIAEWAFFDHYEGGCREGVNDNVANQQNNDAESQNINDAESQNNDCSVIHVCRYVVWPGSNQEDGVTTEKIWQKVGSSGFLANCAGRERLKDLCLSHALHGIILTRFAGLPQHGEIFEKKSREFIQNELLPGEDGERVFRIIEVELEFLFAFFYTKSSVYISCGYSHLWHHVVMIAALFWYDIHGIDLVSSDTTLGVVITRIVILIFCFLEFWTIIIIVHSDRQMVWNICRGIREERATLRRRGIELNQLIINWVWTVKDFLSRCVVFQLFFKPWKRQLGQYSFLEKYGEVPILARFPLRQILVDVVKIPVVGQVGDSSVELSTEVKRAVVTSLSRLLQGDGPVILSRGRATFERWSGLSTEITNACQSEWHDAHVILLWHIATSYCESQNNIANIVDLDERELERGHYIAATQLSKYCAYLVTFAPELLPDHPYITESVFNMAVDQAKRGNDAAHPQRDIVIKGHVLSQKLQNEVILQHPDRGWRVLAEFWAEMLLYLAPSDNVAAHGEHLAQGGEFITHLWALLTHAGVVTRNVSPAAIP